MGWLQKLKNGKLLQEAESAGYEIFLAVDQGVPYQQNLSKRKISILVVRSKTNQLEDLLPLTWAILAAIQTIQPSEVVVVS